MINQITNTIFTNAAALNMLQQNTSQNLPNINSLVLLQVLDRIGSNYKILINGILFQSKLPLGLKVGEETIAKVISQNPFSLKLNDLLKIKNLTSENISLLLSLLGIEQNEKSISFVKELLFHKQALRKSKIKKVLEFIEERKNKIDELQMNLLVKIYSAEDDFLDYLRENEDTVFSSPFLEIVHNIFNSVKYLNIEYGNYPLTQSINNCLVKSTLPDNENKGSKSFNEEKLAELVSYIGFEIKNGANTYTLNQILGELKNNLVHLIIQTSIYNYFGLYPSFIILKRNDELHLIEYNSFKEITDKYLSVFKFGLKVPTDSMEEVIMKGFLSKELLYTNLFLKCEENGAFELELTKTSEEFHFKYDINAYIGVSEPKVKEQPSIWNNVVASKTY